MIKKLSIEDTCNMLGITSLLNDDYLLHWTDYEDTNIICTLLHNKTNILEIGTHLGYTTQNIASTNPSAKITTLDIIKEMNLNIGIQNDEILTKEQSGSVIYADNVNKIYTTSNDFFSTNTQKFDGIFIDGNHSYEQVAADTQNALKFIENNGIIVWHDVYNKDGSCDKCNAEPPNDDVRQLLTLLPITVYKVANSWIAFYIKSENSNETSYI